MRIDYSTPKQSYVSATNKPKARKEPNGLFSATIVITAVISLMIGYGAGWFLSQRSAKKAFQAALEQNSLESSPKQPVAVQPTAQQPIQTTQSPTTGTNPTQTPQGANGAPQPALSFYKALPSGQNDNVLGSGNNATENKIQSQPSINKIVSPATKSVPTVKSEPVAKTMTKQPEKNSYAVQVASYSLKSEAEANRNKLSNKGYNTSIVESNLGDKGIWYRVRVGRKLDQDAAKELAGKLGKGAMVIPD